MTVAIEIGRTATGDSAALDLEELLATRLLVQGNSGSGKSHLLRRLLEQSVAWRLPPSESASIASPPFSILKGSTPRTRCGGLRLFLAACSKFPVITGI